MSPSIARPYVDHLIRQEHGHSQLFRAGSHEVCRCRYSEVSERPICMSDSDRCVRLGGQAESTDWQDAAAAVYLAACLEDRVGGLRLAGHPLGAVGAEDLSDRGGDRSSPVLGGRSRGHFQQVNEAFQVPLPTECARLLATAPERDLRDRKPDQKQEMTPRTTSSRFLMANE